MFADANNNELHARTDISEITKSEFVWFCQKAPQLTISLSPTSRVYLQPLTRHTLVNSADINPYACINNINVTNGLINVIGKPSCCISTDCTVQNFHGTEQCQVLSQNI